MKILDIAFYHEAGLTNPSEILEKHSGSSGHFKYMSESAEVHVIKFCDFNTLVTIDGVHYHFVMGSGLLQRVRKAIQLVREISPDIVINHSLNYPLQTFCLKAFSKILFNMAIQTHAELPGRNFFKRLLQKIAYKSTRAFFFTSTGQAEVFKKNGLIPAEANVFEIMEGSSSFTDSVVKSAPGDYPKFLWTARLLPVKDPITVLKGFLEYKKSGRQFQLTMVYTNNTMENQVRKFTTDNFLSEQVVMLGKAERHDLEELLNKTDYFISGSLHEGSNWSLCEAMSCGCVPVVSDIPPHCAMTRNGECGYLFKAGSEKDLFDQLKSIDPADFVQKSIKAKEIFDLQLSHQAIAKNTIAALRCIMEK